MNDFRSHDKWHRQLEMKNKALEEQNSRLRREVKDKDDDIKSLRIVNLSLECEVFGTHNEFHFLTYTVHCPPGGRVTLPRAVIYPH